MSQGPQESEEEVTVAIGLIRRGDCFLVGERPPGHPLAGYAEFPGGKCLPGESPEQCVVRESFEEAGLHVNVLGIRRVVTHTYAHGRLRLTFFDCTASDETEPRRPFQWVPRAQLAELVFPEANREVLRELLGMESD